MPFHIKKRGRGGGGGLLFYWKVPVLLLSWVRLKNDLQKYTAARQRSRRIYEMDESKLRSYVDVQRRVYFTFNFNGYFIKSRQTLLLMKQHLTWPWTWKTKNLQDLEPKSVAIAEKCWQKWVKCCHRRSLAAVEGHPRFIQGRIVPSMDELDDGILTKW